MSNHAPGVAPPPKLCQIDALPQHVPQPQPWRSCRL